MQWAARRLVEICGSLGPSQIALSHIDILNNKILISESAFTRSTRAACCRRVLRYLVSQHRTKDFTNFICRAKVPRPRNVTATCAERATLLQAASPYLRCWLLLCSDMAIRSGTATRLGPANYDAQRRVLTFTTKYQNRQELPVTAELTDLFSQCPNPDLPFVSQLMRGHYWRFHARQLPTGYALKADAFRSAFRRLKQECGITRDLRPHDLRRTTAKALYDLTNDLRSVQALLGHAQLSSTLWYLDHHVTKDDLSILELAKLNPNTEVIQ